MLESTFSSVFGTAESLVGAVSAADFLLCCVFSVVLGVIFGMYPAIKASGLQPVVALRAE